MVTYHWLIVPFIILCIAVPLGMVYAFGTANTRLMKKLQVNGVRAWARILSVQDTGMTMNDLSFGVRLTVEVQSSVEAPFQAVVETFVSRVNIPRPGDQLEVIYNPQNHSEIAAITS